MELEVTGTVFKGKVVLSGDTSTLTIADLCAEISGKCRLATAQMRLIARGKRLDACGATLTQKLVDVGITPGQRVMLQEIPGAAKPALSVSSPASASASASASATSPSPPVVARQSSVSAAAARFAAAERMAAWREQEIVRMEAAASTLAKRDARRFHGSAVVPELADQHGRPVHLLPEDAEALKEGLLLHARGRYVMQQWDRRRQRRAGASMPSRRASPAADAATDEPPPPEGADAGAATEPVATHTVASPGLPDGRPSLTAMQSEDDRASTLALTLALFLKADAAFSRANQSIVEVLDNPPQLYLDIVWTYFLMNDISRLEDAAGYLRRCRAGFERAHGKNLERLQRLKGEGASERALYVRLRLLEGVIASVTGNTALAERHLRQARAECDMLMPSPADISATLEACTSFGLDATRADVVRALRSTRQASPPAALVVASYDTDEAMLAAVAAIEAAEQEKVNRAVSWLMERREQKRERARRERQQELRERRQRLFGATASGAMVDLDKLDAIAGVLSLDETVIAEALKQTDNDEVRAISLLTDPEGLVMLQSTTAISGSSIGEKRRSAPSARLSDTSMPEAAHATREVAGSLLRMHDAALPSEHEPASAPLGAQAAPSNAHANTSGRSDAVDGADHDELSGDDDDEFDEEAADDEDNEEAADDEDEDVMDLAYAVDTVGGSDPDDWNREDMGTYDLQQESESIDHFLSLLH